MRAKQVFDRLAGVVGLVVFLPLIVTIAGLIVLFDGNPVTFQQERIGRDTLFTIHKFRTFRNGKRTRLGRILRWTSLDELPQFWNLVRGDMSLVGPRPEIPHLAEDFTLAIPSYAQRHRAKPGLTGFAQVHGFRGCTSVRERVRYDNYYIDNWSFWLDLRIILRTPLAILAGSKEEA